MPGATGPGSCASREANQILRAARRRDPALRPVPVFVARLTGWSILSRHSPGGRRGGARRLQVSSSSTFWDARDVRDILAHWNIPCGAYQTDGMEESSRELRRFAVSLQPD